MKITNVSKLEKNITDMTNGFSFYTCKSSCVIGKTDNKVIVISVYNVREFEDEFNEDFDSIDEKHFCLSL